MKESQENLIPLERFMVMPKNCSFIEKSGRVAAVATFVGFTLIGPVAVASGDGDSNSETAIQTALDNQTVISGAEITPRWLCEGYSYCSRAHGVCKEGISACPYTYTYCSSERVGEE